MSTRTPAADADATPELPTSAESDAALPPLRRNRDFNLLWAGGTLSDIGSFTSLLAIPLLVLAITGSAAQAGTVGTVSALMRGLARLPGGALADRLHRRRLLLTCDFVRMLLFAILALAVVTQVVSVPLILVIVGSASLCDVLFTPAELASVSRLVPAPQLRDAFARNEARSYAASLVGPPLGGLLYGLGRAVPFAFDAASYLVSFLSISAIKTPLQEGERPAPTQHLGRDILDGVRHVLSDAYLRALLLVAAPLNFAVTAALFTMTITLRQHGISPGMVGAAQGIIGVGGLVGALLAPRLSRLFSLRFLIVATCWALAVCFAVAGQLTFTIAMAAPITCGLVLAPAANAVMFGRLAETTPDHLQARVVSVVFFAATTAAGVAPLASGILIEHVTGQTAMALAAAAAAGSAVAGTLSRGIRNQA
jgi:MFS family permease